MEKTLFELRPSLAVAMIPASVVALILSIFAGLFTFSASRNTAIAFFVAILVFVIFVFFRYMNLKSRKYIFYQDKAEFYEGFLNIVQRTVQYEKVTDCILTKSVWDRIFKTGTIQLVTAGTAPIYAKALAMGGGVILQYISNPDDAYQKVQKLLKK